MKTCTKCHTPRELVEFVKDNRRADGRGSWCLECNRTYYNAYSLTSKRQASRGAYYRANKTKLNSQAHERWATKKDQYGIARDKWALEHRAELLASDRARGVKHLAFVNALKAGKLCLDCGRSFPPYVMEYDHVRGLKRWAIGKMANHRREAVLAEIAKCDLVCCVCHRIRTQVRKGGTLIPRSIEFRTWINTLKTNPCADCGRTLPHVAMDFDHVRGEKTRGISGLGFWKREKVLEEIAKCELVCANCHRIRTQSRVEEKVAA